MDICFNCFVPEYSVVFIGSCYSRCIWVVMWLTKVCGICGESKLWQLWICTWTNQVCDLWKLFLCGW